MPDTAATTRRRFAIRDLLSDVPIATQDALARVLASRGFQVTQSTLSRDLRALGVVKTPSGYAIPGDNGGFSHSVGGSDRLPSVLRATLIDAVPAASLVVLRTAPGHAQPVGLALDAARIDGVVGNVSGDDTVFVASTSNTEARRLAAYFREIAGLMGDSGCPGVPGESGLMGAA